MTIVNAQLRTASKGLITEVHGLNLPSDASVDELNCEIDLNDIRRPRKGVEYEANHVLSSFSVTQGDLVTEVDWANAGGVASRQFLVVQVGFTLYFYDKSIDPISSGLKSFSVDLNDFDAGNEKELAKNPIQGASLDGVFVVAHPGTELFFIEYDSITDSISTTQINPKIRDFEWQGEVSTYVERNEGETTGVTVPFFGYLEYSTGVDVPPTRIYDTKNAGWDDDFVQTSKKPLATYTTAGFYPPLTVPWFAGKDENDEFSIAEFEKVYAGTSLIGNGHFILDFFNKDREYLVEGTGIEREASRFTSVAAWAGRFWYAGLESSKNSGRVLFTKIIENSQDYEHCYQANDPTSEVISDLLDTDGGNINIPGAYGIKHLYPYGSSLLVFAENGVWVIKGVDEVFKATEYGVSKLSQYGLVNVLAFVDADNTPFWWSEFGVHTMVRDPTSQQPIEQSLSRQSIQTFWNSIDEEKKLQAKGAYDTLNKKIYWLYPDNTETVDFKYNKILVFDLNKGAFLPWEVVDQDTATNYIVGLTFTKALGATDEIQNVTVNGTLVTENTEAVTWDGGVTLAVRDSQIKLLVRDGNTEQLTVALFGDTDFLDWNEKDYDAYIELGYADFENFGVRKHPLYITTYFERTEDGWLASGDNYVPTNQSSCQLSVFWDYKDTASSTQQVYRLKKLPVVDEGDLTSFDYPTPTVINKTKIKGRGRLVNLKFSKTSGKTFKFMGYSLVVDRHDNL